MRNGGEHFYEEVLIPCGGNLREGLARHLCDGLGWLVVGASDSGTLHKYGLS